MKLQYTYQEQRSNLRHLAHFLEGVPERKFDIRTWACGSAACAGGWCPVAFDHMGDENPWGYDYESAEENEDARRLTWNLEFHVEVIGISEFFGLKYPGSPFDPCAYKFGKYAGWALRSNNNSEILKEVIIDALLDASFRLPFDLAKENARKVGWITDMFGGMDVFGGIESYRPEIHDHVL